MEISSGRASLATEVVGEGDPTVLLLHAGVTDQRSWRPLVEVLSPHARCVSFDRRGYGRTTYEPEDGWSPVADAIAVLDGVGAEQAVVVGASMGGATAIDLTLAHPERVRLLILIGAAITGAPRPDELSESVRRLDEAGDAAYERGDLDELNRIEATIWLDGPDRPGRVTGTVRDLFLEMNGHALAAQDPGDQAEPPSAWDRLRRITVPTLVVVGSLDLDHVRHNARHLAATIPEARLLEVPDVAHLPHLEGDPTTLHAIEHAVRES